jgi:hypothetical protein
MAAVTPGASSTWLSKAAPTTFPSELTSLP